MHNHVTELSHDHWSSICIGICVIGLSARICKCETTELWTVREMGYDQVTACHYDHATYARTSSNTNEKVNKHLINFWLIK